MNCKICKSNKLIKVLNLRNLPISNNYISINKSKYISNYILLSCTNCSVIQAKKNYNINRLVPKNKKLKQNEPEKHLDGLVQKILKKKILHKKSNILCLSYKDQSLADRFKAKGYKNIDMLNYKNFFKSKNIFFENLEIFNKKKYFVNNRKKYDLIIGRHIIEHFFDPSKFLNNLKLLLNPKKGFVYFEIPDSLKSMKKFDYNMLWEQHKMYFTSSSLKSLMSLNNFNTVLCDIYKYKYENCILYLGKINKLKKRINKKYIKKENLIVKNYFEALKKNQKKILAKINNLSKRGSILIYGAGHQTVMNIYLFKYKKAISHIVDDNKYYQNNYLPGTNILITKISSNLNFDYVFISSSFENKKKILKNKSSILKGKKIFSLSFYENSFSLRKFINGI